MTPAIIIDKAISLKLTTMALIEKIKTEKIYRNLDPIKLNKRSKAFPINLNNCPKSTSSDC